MIFIDSCQGKAIIMFQEKTAEQYAGDKWKGAIGVHRGGLRTETESMKVNSMKVGRYPEISYALTSTPLFFSLNEFSLCYYFSHF